MKQEKGIDRDLILANTNVLSAIGVVSILGLLVVPVAPLLLDLLLTFSIAFGVVIMLVSLYLKEPLHFSAFPSLLLIVTLFRLSLNVASTRLILSNASAGQVIQSFGDFVVGGNYVIGVIVFVILIIVNFMVITKGSGRIAEVAARFTLDAMPGKQMAIDADLNTGLIDEQQARSRRAAIAAEAEFFGAMDGASKFVRGDAIAGIIITLINIAGGFIIGMLQMGMEAGESLARFTILTVGDGLVSQIPALLVSTSAGLVVTRQSSSMNLGQVLTLQLFRQNKAIFLSSGTLVLFALIPGLPTIPFLLLAGIIAGLAYVVGNRVKKLDQETEDEALAASLPPVAEAPSDWSEELFITDRLELEIGYGLIPLVDESKAGDLLQRIGSIRRQLGTELGIFIHPIRVRDNLQLDANDYNIKLKGVEIARGSLLPDRLLAMCTTPDGDSIDGIQTVEPAFNLPAVWIEPDRKTTAEMEGYTVVEPTAVLSTHLSEVIRSNAGEILSRQDVKDLCESVREFAPALVEEIIPDKVPVNILHNVLRSLLHERVPVRDITTVLETLANHCTPSTTADYLTGKVREALARTISSLFTESDGRIHAISLHPFTEQQFMRAAQNSDQTGGLILDPRFTQEYLGKLDATLRQAYAQGHPPVLMVPSPIRLFMKRLIEPTYPNLAVLGYSEVAASARVQAAGTVVTDGIQQEESAVG
ncbi:MAG: flagellar biosynthesis protein FlhA [bacterium]